MKFFLKKHINCYCSFCKSPRRVYRKRGSGFFEIASSMTAALLLMYMIWRQVDPRFMLFFVAFLALSEIMIQIRWRLSIACSKCGFDPVLYIKNPETAAQKVKIHLERRRQDPQFLLSKPLNLPTISPERATELQKKAERRAQLLSQGQSASRGQMLSRKM